MEPVLNAPAGTTTREPRGCAAWQASMADWMALNAGVIEPDLEELKRQAPLLVANAAEQERLNLAGFAQQAREWIDDRNRCKAA